MLKWIISFVIILLLIGFLFAAFLFGPLMPLSPFKPEYNSINSGRITVYYPWGTQVPDYYRSLDKVMVDMEKTFEMNFRSDLSIYRLKKPQLKRALPWMKTDSLEGVALRLAPVVYISYEKIKDENFSEEEYLRHEMTHALIHQNTPLFNLMKTDDVEYLSEGVPFYYGGPNYYPRAKFLEYLNKDVRLTKIIEGDSIYDPSSFEGLKGKRGEPNKFEHLLYGEFIRFLRNSYGDRTFNAFLKDYLNEPDKHRELFEQHFRIPLTTAQEMLEEHDLLGD